MFLYFTSCNKEEVMTETFYYDVYSSKMEVVAYYETLSTTKEKVRVDTIRRYNLEGDEKEKRIEKYIVSKDTLYKIDFNNNKYPYLIIDDQNCNLIDRNNEIKTCLLKRKDSLIFTEQTLITDGVKRKLTFDKSFNLIENEYLDGYLSYYKITRRETKPSILSK